MPLSSKDKDALHYHRRGRPGKIEILPTKTLETQRDLSLAYSPGVAAPCREILALPQKAYELTAKGNLVAVISNGSAVLGLGNLGAQASKPVMEGKAVLFKKFADVDAIDIELDTNDVDAFINAVKYMGPTFGGINLEDVKAPECFIIEDRLKELMDIPVFHDDQHGTAICILAGLINGFTLTNRSIETARFVINGAGAAAIACADLLRFMGASSVILCDRSGVIYEGRDGLNPWKERHASKTPYRTLDEALEGADVLIGLSAKGAVSPGMLKSMAPNPLVFALANPDPEITPEEAHAVRDDVIMATGRSDYPNQINNVLCFPYLFRGALDVQATEINNAMKVAAAEALAALARKPIPEKVGVAYNHQCKHFGPDYIIPVPFDPRLIRDVSVAVAKAAMDTGVARKPLTDMDAYSDHLRVQMDPIYSSLSLISQKNRQQPRKMVFAEGEEDRMIRAAVNYALEGFGQSILIGRESVISERMAHLGLEVPESVRIHNAKLSDDNKTYIQSLYTKLQRQGYLYRDCQRLVHQDRNVFGASMLLHGHADAMVTGLTRNYHTVYTQVSRLLEPRDVPFGLSIVVLPHRTLFIADTTIHTAPSASMLCAIARQAALKARSMGHEPRVAFVSYSTFGNPPSQMADLMHEAVAYMDKEDVDFEYEGEISVDIALQDSMKKLYPFSRLSGPANILIMPDVQAASIAAQLLGHMAHSDVIGPILMGFDTPVQIASMSSSASDVLNLANLAAYQSHLYNVQ